VLDPSKRFATLVLTAGILVLLLAIVLGEGMGQSVLRNVDEGNAASIKVTITPNPAPSSTPFGPDWKQSQALAAAPDPKFPDPRVPPVALPTATPRPSSVPKSTPTPNPAIPIWRQQQPLPTTPPDDRHLVPQSNVTPAPAASPSSGSSPQPLHP